MGEEAGIAPRLEALEQLARAGTWSVATGTGDLWWSDGQHRIHGVDAGAVRDLDDWSALVHPEDRELWRSTLDDALAAGRGYAIDHRILHAGDGGVRWLRCRGRIEGGHLHGVSVDRTDEHDAGETMRSFVADAAHELRTPASAIGQAVAALQLVDDEAQRAEVLGVLERQAARLRALTNDLVDLAALDAGPVAIVLVPVAVADAVRAAVEHAPPPPDRFVSVGVADDLSVLATAGHLDRVLVNLLTNAYRYGGTAITVGARLEGDDRVVLEVADDGPGVPAEAVDTLFRAFRRGPQRHPGASGLGLAIVARLVHRFGGTVGYRPGEPGAVFSLTLQRS